MKRMGANRQLIAHFFPTADRSAFVALGRLWIASFGVGPDCLWWHIGSLSLLWSTSTRSPEPTMATPRKSCFSSSFTGGATKIFRKTAIFECPAHGEIGMRNRHLPRRKWRSSRSFK